MAVTHSSPGRRARTRSVPRQRTGSGSERPRLLIGTDTYPPDVNGAAFFTARLAHGLAERGADVHVLCQSPDGPPRVIHAGGVVEHRLRSMSSLVHDTVRLAIPLGVPGHIDRLLVRLRPDVVHVQNHFIVGRLLIAAARRHGIPVVATNHFMPENLFNYMYIPPGLRDAVGAFAWRDFCRVLADVDHVTTPTRTAAQLLVDQGYTSPVEAVSCGIDLVRFHPCGRAPTGVRERLGRSDRRDLRARLGIPDRPTVLFVGRLDEEKRIDDLIGALPLVTAEDAQLVLVGTGAQRQRLERCAEAEGVADRVHFLGFVEDDDLPVAYRAADVFAIASIAELQSIATLEAMASGLPVVAAEAMALPQLVDIGRNGYLYEPGSRSDLAKYLSEILSDDAERARMGHESREMAAHHDHQRSLARFEEIYAQVADRARNRRGR
ncbi:glycosyltransferase involved in cell wall biosynthesis [Nocardiopsis mwathae]|uniref:Glycosyltransferase involved in cell wall biosynthesis n=1 Tax=Nocardiopsis mwathae TaxID=1472723 RepID=A0A7W9YL79_9ACTN|nr:glycosyltransferase [Nocardiopsis mwathae]MBB6173596.1 glycosyltransferase involved in cell wall biosynthesis [Nocardiopsis mwathae]